jgi:hypothetical protein
MHVDLYANQNTDWLARLYHVTQLSFHSSELSTAICSVCEAFTSGCNLHSSMNSRVDTCSWALSVEYLDIYTDQILFSGVGRT